jgi:uncharacterized protein
MSDSGLKERITESMKAAMRAQEKERLGIIRLIQAAIKQWEVDERITLNDEQILSLLDKMVRQRKEAIKQFDAGNRRDLSDKENFEIGIIQEFLPSPLSEEEITLKVKAAITELNANSIKDMGKVMARLKPDLQGRADMTHVGTLVKTLLTL